MRPGLLNAVILAALMVAASVALLWLENQGVVPADRRELTERCFNLVLGLIVVAAANSAPKRMRPLSGMACDPAREQATRRFSGLAIVVGGLLYALAWAAAPIGLAAPLSMAALGGSLTVVLARRLFTVARR